MSRDSNNQPRFDVKTQEYKRSLPERVSKVWIVIGAVVLLAFMYWAWPTPWRVHFRKDDNVITESRINRFTGSMCSFVFRGDKTVKLGYCWWQPRSRVVRESGETFLSDSSWSGTISVGLSGDYYINVKDPSDRYWNWNSAVVLLRCKEGDKKLEERVIIRRGTLSIGGKMSPQMGKCLYHEHGVPTSWSLMMRENSRHWSIESAKRKRNWIPGY